MSRSRRQDHPTVCSTASSSRFAFRPLSLGISWAVNPVKTATLVAASLSGVAIAGPDGGEVVAGSATISNPSLATTVINQSSARAAINWQNFSIGSSEYVQFIQPGSSSVALNRVVGGDPSSILGSLTANGQVFLVNPAGVYFGRGAVLDVGGLVATTMAIDTDDFMTGNYVFNRDLASPTTANVVNEGIIAAREGGYVVLSGDYVENSGVIDARLGTVALAAGAGMTLDITGNDLINFTVDAAALSSLAGVDNSGDLYADGGRVIMTAEVAGTLVNAAVNNSGRVQAQGIVEQDGAIYLVANGGDVENSGILDASGPSGDGGFIRVRSDHDVTLTSTSEIDASGADGVGGVVRVIAEQTLDFQAGAEIKATGSGSNDGGFVEVSGHGGLTLQGDVEVGNGGQLLIDPLFLTINGGGSTSPSGSATSAAIGEFFIETQLKGGANVALVATNDITFSGGFVGGDLNGQNAGSGGDLFIGIGSIAGSSNGFSSNSFDLPVGPPPGFTASSNGTVNLNGVNLVVDGDLTIQAGSSVGTISGLGASNQTTNGDIALSATFINSFPTGSIQLGISALAGNINITGTINSTAFVTLNAGGTIDVTGDIFTGNFGALAGLPLGVAGSLITAEGAITINGDLTALVSSGVGSFGLLSPTFDVVNLVQSKGSSVTINGDMTAIASVATSNEVNVGNFVITGDNAGGPSFTPIQAGGDININGTLHTQIDNATGKAEALTMAVAYSDGTAGVGGDVFLNTGALRAVVTGSASTATGFATATAVAGDVTQAAGHVIETDVAGVHVYTIGGLTTGAVGRLASSGRSIGSLIARKGSGDIFQNGLITVHGKGSSPSARVDARAGANAFSDGSGVGGGTVTLGAGGSIEAKATGKAGIKAGNTLARAGAFAGNNTITQQAGHVINGFASAGSSDGFGSPGSARVLAGLRTGSFLDSSSSTLLIAGSGDISQQGSITAVAAGSGHVRAVSGVVADGKVGTPLSGGAVLLDAGGLVTATAEGFAGTGSQASQASANLVLRGGASLTQDSSHVVQVEATALNSSGMSFNGQASADLSFETGVFGGGTASSYIAGGDISLAGSNTVTAVGHQGASYNEISVLATGDGSNGGDISITGGTFAISAVKLGSTSGGTTSYVSVDIDIEAEDGLVDIDAGVTLSATATAAASSALVQVLIDGGAGVTIDSAPVLSATGDSDSGTQIVVAGGGLVTGAAVLTADRIVYNPRGLGHDSDSSFTFSYGSSSADFNVLTNAAEHIISDNLDNVVIDNSAFTGAARLALGASYDFTLPSGSSFHITGGGGAENITFTAGGDLNVIGATAGSRDVDVGDMTLNVAGNIDKNNAFGGSDQRLKITTTGDFTVNSGTINVHDGVFASVDIIAGGDVVLQTTNVFSSSTSGGGAMLQVQASGDVTLDGPVLVREQGHPTANATVLVDAGGLIAVNGSVTAQAIPSAASGFAQITFDATSMDLAADITARNSGSGVEEVLLNASGAVTNTSGGSNKINAFTVGLNVTGGSSGAVFGSAGNLLRVNTSDLNLGNLGSAFVSNALAGVYNLAAADIAGQNLTLKLAGGLNLDSSFGFVTLNVDSLNLDVGGAITADLPQVQINAAGDLVIKATSFDLTGSVSSATLIMSAAGDMVIDTPINLTVNSVTPSVLVDLDAQGSLTINQAIVAEATGDAGASVIVDLEGGATTGAVNINGDISAIVRAQGAAGPSPFDATINIVGAGTSDVFLNSGTVLASVSDGGSVTPNGGTALVHAEASGGNLTQLAGHTAKANARGAGNTTNATVELTADDQVNVAGTVTATARGKAGVNALAHIHEHVGAINGSVNVTGATITATAADLGAPVLGTKTATLEIISEQGGVTVNGATTLVNSAITGGNSALAKATIEAAGGLIHFATDLTVLASANGFASADLDMDATTGITGGGDMHANAQGGTSSIAVARLEVDTAAGNVTLGDVSVTADGRDAVANLDIGGSGSISGVLSVNNVTGSANGASSGGSLSIDLQAVGGLSVSGAINGVATGASGDANAYITMFTGAPGAEISVTGPINATATAAGGSDRASAGVFVYGTGDVELGNVTTTATAGGDAIGVMEIETSNGDLTLGNLTVNATANNARGSGEIGLDASNGAITAGALTVNVSSTFDDARAKIEATAKNSVIVNGSVIAIADAPDFTGSPADVLINFESVDGGVTIDGDLIGRASGEYGEVEIFVTTGNGGIGGDINVLGTVEARATMTSYADQVDVILRALGTTGNVNITGDVIAANIDTQIDPTCCTNDALVQIDAVAGSITVGGRVESLAVGLDSDGATADVRITAAQNVTLTGGVLADALTNGSGAIASVIVTAGNNLVTGAIDVNAFGGSFNSEQLQLNQGGKLTTSGVLTADSLSFGGAGGFDVLTAATNLTINSGSGDAVLDNTAFVGPAQLQFAGSGYNNINVTFGGDGTVLPGTATATNDLFIGAIGSLDVSDTNLTAGGSLDLVAGGGNLLVSNANLVGGRGVFLSALDSVIGSIAKIDGGMLGVFAGNDIDLSTATINVGTNSDATRLPGDPLVTDFLLANGISVPSVNPNALFLAGDSVQIGDLDMSGHYLWIEANDVSFTGTVTTPENVLVQLLPSDPLASIGFENSIANLQQVNYGNSEHLSPFTGTSIAIGSSFHQGGIVIGDLGLIDIGDKNILFVTQNGNVTGDDQVLTTGLLALLSLIPIGDELVEIVDTIASVDDLVDTGGMIGAGVIEEDVVTEEDSDEDEEEEQQADGEGDESSGEGGALIEQDDSGEQSLECA